MKFVIRELLKFYDENYKVKKHSNSIKNLFGEELGIDLFVNFLGKYYYKELEYFCCRGGEYIFVGAEEYSAGEFGTCSIPTKVTLSNPSDNTSSIKKSHSLDGIVRCPLEKVAYLLEVKSWSIHSLGGRSFNLKENSIKKVAKNVWEHRPKEKNHADNINPSLAKVLTLPTNSHLREYLKGYTIQPVIVYWLPLLPERGCVSLGAHGEDYSIKGIPVGFEQQIKDSQMGEYKDTWIAHAGKFGNLNLSDKLIWFSQSAYLRWHENSERKKPNSDCGDTDSDATCIDLPMPRTQARLKFINEMISS
ncbi:hypothetical protein [Labrenzia sp. VG12]|uniref:hypothetical protein n=1 Tax=Labrenzia sp. VG12 TaxID=2021862 RepID=UPI0012FDCC5E|nr:hypothetical protein [Labrenzia sp. VG12]